MGSLTTKLLSEDDGNQIMSLGSGDVDVTNKEATEKVIQEFEPDVVLNFVVYNADGAIHNLDSNEIDKQIDVNIKGALNILGASLELMRKKSFGRIIFLSSILSNHPVFGTALYSGSKGFIDNLIKTAAIENSKHSITVNSIQLGYFEAGLIHKVPKDMLESVINKIPLKRLGTGRELVNAIEFLIKTEYVTGLNLPMSGGLNLSSL